MGRTTDDMPITRTRSSVGIVLSSTRSRGRVVTVPPQVQSQQKPSTPPPNYPPPRPPKDRGYAQALNTVKPLLARVAESTIAPQEKDEYRRELAAADQLSLDSNTVARAIKKLNALAERMRRALEIADNAPEGKERGGKKLRAKAERERERAEKELLAEATLINLPGELDLGKIREILAEHKQAVPKEEAVLDEFEVLDDVLNNRKLKEDPDLMREKLTAIGAAMRSGYDRQKRMAAALKVVPKPGDNASPEDRKAYNDAMILSASMVDHIPQEWQAQWGPNFDKRIVNLTAPPETKAQNLIDAKGAFSEDDKKRHREVLKKGIEANSTRKLDRVEFFYDRMTKAATPQQLQDLAKIQEEVMAVGTKILDSGGKLSDVHQALAHIPESWWPPAFVDYLQAWRKTEREMQRLRVAKMFEKDSKLDTALDTVEGILGFLGTVGSTGGALTGAIAPEGSDGKAPASWTTAEGVQKAIGAFAEGVQKAIAHGRGSGEAMNKEFFDREHSVLEVFGTPEKMEATAAKLLEITRDTASTIVSATKGIAIVMEVPKQSELLTTILPGISMAVAGLDLYLAIRSLAKHARTLSKTKGMIPDAELDWARGLDEDGGAFVRALGNEVQARKLQIGKDSVNVTDKTLGMAGATASTFGGQYGMIAGVGLKVVGKVIVYSGKIVFTNIEWSRANTAKGLIKRAQAGDPAARIELMSDCGLYAKMYIAILAREGHKKALVFIADRGIEESDLEGGVLALKIVVDEMLKDADQPDETKIADNWAEANLNGLGLGGAIKLGKTVAGGVKSIVDEIRALPKSSRDTPYDENWVHKPEHVALTASAWAAAKNEAKKAGLFDYSTGIGAKFEAVQATYTRLADEHGTVERLTEAIKAKLPGRKPKEEKDRIIEVLDSLDVLYGELIAYQPYANPPSEKADPPVHKGMVLYLAELKTKIMDERGRFDALLIDGGMKDPNWKTDYKDPLPDEWNKAFAECAKTACLSDDDLGVGKALAAFHKCEIDPAMAENNPDPQQRRKALLAAHDAGNAALLALDSLYGSARECQGLREYIDRIKDVVAELMREWDEKVVTVGGQDWVNPAESVGAPQRYTAAVWKRAWDQAIKDGMASANLKDGGLHDALTKAESSKTSLDKIDQKKDPKDKMKARHKYQQALARVYAAARACAAAQKAAPKSFANYVAETGKWAQEAIAKVREEQGAVGFPVVEGFDPKSFAKTDDNAKKAGAVGSSGGKMKTTENALSDYVKAKEACEKSGSKQDRKAERAAAVDRESALQAVIAAATDALTAEGYAENKQMTAYLEGLQAEAERLLAVPVFKSILDGSSTAYDKFDPGAFTWSNDAWQKVKGKAVAAGLMADAATGFGAALDKAKEKYDEWMAADGPTKGQTVGKVAAAIEAAQGQADKLADGTKNAKLKAFFQTGSSLLGKKLAEVRTDTTTPFQPPIFTWSNSAWQTVKAEAVIRRLMADKKTGLGEAISDAKEPYAEWAKLSPVEKVNGRAAVEKVLAKVRDIAANYRETIDHPALKIYFAQAVAMAEQRIASLQGDGVKSAKLDVPTFSWSNAEWQKVKKAAVEAGLVLDDATGFGDALDKAKTGHDSYGKARDKNDNKKLAKARAEAVPLVETAKGIAVKLGAATVHPGLKKYFGQAVTLADAMLDEMSENKVDFTPPPFEWKNDAWQAVKKEAIKLGLIQDEKTGFGDALSGSLKKVASFVQAKQKKESSKIESTREPARAAVAEVRRMALEMQAASKHDKLRAYFQGCVTKADKYLDDLKP